MRWVLASLLLANVAFLGWQIQRDRAPPPSAAAPPSTPPGMVNRLLLIDEIDAAALRERRGSLAVEPSLTPSDSVKLDDVLATMPERARQAACFTVGPLEGEAPTDAVRAWFAEHAQRATLRVDERREVARYWVYLPPLAEREAAEKRAREMRAAGIDDIYVIPRGDMANAISLGLYSQRDSLERRLRALERKGYTPSIAPRYRTLTASWLDVVALPEHSVPVEEFARRFPELQLSPTVCAGV